MSFDKYNHQKVETKIYSYWEKNNLFKPKKNKDGSINNNLIDTIFKSGIDASFTHGNFISSQSRNIAVVHEDNALGMRC